MKNHRGLVLIELIAVIVLIGIIGTFTTFFLYTGLSGYLKAKKTLSGTLDAQMALDRISHELRNLDYFAAPLNPNTSLSYTSEVLTGTRALKYNSNTIWIGIGATDYKLLENVNEFTLSATAQDLNADGVDDVAFIEVGFKVNEIGKEFKTKIFPRHMVKNK